MPSGEQGFLFTSSAENDTDLNNTVSLEEIKAWMDRVINVAHYSLVLINSCYSGAFFNTPLAYGTEQHIPKERGAHVITACSADEKAYADLGNTESAFFEMVINGIKGAADDGDNVITADELAAYIRKTAPLFGDKQHPMSGNLLKGGSKGSFFFINKNKPIRWAAVKPEPESTLAYSGPSPTPTTVIGAHGTLVVEAVTEGTLYLDGSKIVDLAAGGTYNGSVEVGNRSLELHYKNGQVEQQIVAVREGSATTVSFTYVEQSKGQLTWIERKPGGSRDWACISSSSDGSHIAACADGLMDAGGHIYTSTDGGVTWSDRTVTRQTEETFYWGGISSSSDGGYLAACVGLDGDIYTSTDGGATWTDRKRSGKRRWGGICSSSDGSHIAAISQSFDENHSSVGPNKPGDIYTSTDGGDHWTDQKAAGSRYWGGICSSSDGSHIAACEWKGDPPGGDIYTSTDGGATWTDQKAAGSRYWGSICSSSDGSHIAAYAWVSDQGGDIYTSTDGGATWIDQKAAGARKWSGIASSSDGSHIAAYAWVSDQGGDIYTSTDGGATWTDQKAAGSRKWTGIASSSDGSHIAACVYYDGIVTGQ
jgi:photosystem II stability/assembly factor-like uncharacterized protein